MSPLEKAEKLVQELNYDELSRFRTWFAEYDAERWDRQIEEDVRAGRLDALAEDALRHHALSAAARAKARK